MSLNTTPATWTTSQVVTAANLNTEVRDAMTGLQAAWDTWTPTWTNLTVGNGTVVARYFRQGKTIQGFLSLQWGSTTSGAGITVASLPVAMAASYASTDGIGSGMAIDTSAGGSGRYACSVWVQSQASSTISWNANNTSLATTNLFVYTTGDRLTATFMYEAA